MIDAKVLEITNRTTLARAVLIPTWTATTSSLPMMRSAKPSRERPISQPTRNTTAERQQQPIQRLVRHGDQHIEPAAGAHDVLRPGHDLAHQLGEAEREDDEIDAGDAQGGEADDQGEQRTGDRRDDDEGRIRQIVEAGGHDIHADAEERRGGERDVVGRAGEQRPRRRQHGEHGDRDAEREPIAGAGKRQQRSGGEQQRRDGEMPLVARAQGQRSAKAPRRPRQRAAVRPEGRLAAGQDERLPNSPSGRTSRMMMNSM